MPSQTSPCDAVRSVMSLNVLVKVLVSSQRWKNKQKWLGMEERELHRTGLNLFLLQDEEAKPRVNTGSLSQAKMQSRCFGWCDTVNQPPGKEGDTKNLMFADTGMQGPKARESHRENIYSPQGGSNCGEDAEAGVGGRWTQLPLASWAIQYAA